MADRPALQIVRSDDTVARVTIARGDITRFSADALVNAANSALAGGGGVDGAIHDAAGPELMAELRARYRGCPVGSAVVTGAGRLAESGVRYVIHAVGPIWRGGSRGESEQLASAYRSALQLAREVGAHSVAFPAISCGAYGYPLDAAAAVALRVVAQELETLGPPDLTTFVLHSAETAEAFSRVLSLRLDRVGDVAEGGERS